MSTLPAPSRQSAHFFLDAVTLYVASARAPLKKEAAAYALQRAGNVDGAIDAKYRRLTNRIDVDLSHLFEGLLWTISWLARELAAVRGTSVESVIQSAHDHLES